MGFDTRIIGRPLNLKSGIHGAIKTCWNRQFVFLSIIVLFSVGGCTSENAENASHVKATNEIAVDLFVQYLGDPLWTDRDAYDAGHTLMVPLHWAFSENNKELKTAFDEHFEKMLVAYSSDEITLGTLNELQYLSLASRYLTLESIGSEDGLRLRLANLVFERFFYYWREKPAWQWDRAAFEGGIRNRIIWKLEENKQLRSYYNIFFDQEFYVIGLAADLLSFYSKLDKKECSSCRDAITLFKRMIQQRLNTSVEGFVFQAGMWQDHHTYAYTGYLTPPKINSPPVIVEKIQEDSSHAHRWPLWLLQLSAVMDVSDIRNRIHWQFINVVLDHDVTAGVPVLKNFICGHNGYYRWNYSTHEEGTGYGPYELSGTFSLGWWSLLGGFEMADLYFNLADAYPLNKAQLELYTGKSTRERHPIVRNGHINGLRQNLSRMASDLSRNFVNE